MSCACGKNASYRRVTPKHLLTTVGGVEIDRRYYACRHCGRKRLPWDDWAGLDAIQVTPHARKVIVTVSCAWSFDRASAKLKEICRMKVSDDTIERICQHEGEEARQWLRGSEKAVESFAPAGAVVEACGCAGLSCSTRRVWRRTSSGLTPRRLSTSIATPSDWRTSPNKRCSVPI